MPSRVSGAVLTIDLAALRSNYRMLQRKAGKAHCAAAIKGNAYGLGLAASAKALWAEGCRSFFVARPEEGEDLRAILPRATITVLDGFYRGEASYFSKHKLAPALTTSEQVTDWAKLAAGLSCSLHVDTGINRAGLESDAFLKLARDNTLLSRLNVRTLMSHLACADDPAHPMNAAQLERFKQLRTAMPQAKASFANSSGIFLGKAYHFDEVRPGIALYGGNPLPHTKNPMKPVVHLAARILQVRDVPQGETVGYSATWKAKRPSRIAIIAAGYADGIARKLSSVPQGGPAHVAIAGQRCPVVGRVSMDMMTIDVTDVPQRKLTKATHAELLGKHISIDEMASWAGTIAYELLTHLGARYQRLYST
jgi:alanine racemase